MVNDGPVLDERLPAFGCGPSFGMLGPTRLVVAFANIPAGWESYSGGMVLGHRGDVYGGSPPFFAEWGGIWDDVRVAVFFSLVVPSTGFWRINADVNTTPPTGSGGCLLETTNLTWQFPPLILGGGGPWGSAAVHRIAEWQTITERFPGAAFPDEV